MKLFLSVISTGANVDRPLSITLNQEGATLGRGEDNALVLPDLKRYISGRHAVIEYRAPDYFITDTSANGVIINQSPLPLGKGNRVKLKDGDQLHIGDYILAVKMIEENLPQVEIDTGPLKDQGFDFPDDPFAELASDPIQGMIDKNELIPSDWKGDQESSEDPFDIPIEAHLRKEDTPETKDFDHVPAYKEAYQPIREKPSGQPAAQAPPVNPADIFPEDWYLKSPAKKDKKTDASLAADSSKSGAFPPNGEAHYQAPVANHKPDKTCTAAVFQDELIQNFLRGAKLENSRYAETLTPESFYIIGKMLRASIQGAMDVLLGRAKIKNEMHLDVTMIRSRQNNPIKFSVSADEALAKLLALQDKGYLQPEEAIEEAFDDIRAHQYSVIAGMKTALLTVLQRFDPDKLEQRLQEISPISASIPIHKQAKLWNLFEHLYQDIEHEAEDNFYHLFGHAFAETYEQQMQKLKKSKNNKPAD